MTTQLKRIVVVVAGLLLLIVLPLVILTSTRIPTRATITLSGRKIGLRVMDLSTVALLGYGSESQVTQVTCMFCDTITFYGRPAPQWPYISRPPISATLKAPNAWAALKRHGDTADLVTAYVVNDEGYAENGELAVGAMGQWYVALFKNQSRAEMDARTNAVVEIHQYREETNQLEFDFQAPAIMLSCLHCPNVISEIRGLATVPELLLIRGTEGKLLTGRGSNLKFGLHLDKKRELEWLRGKRLLEINTSELPQGRGDELISTISSGTIEIVVGDQTRPVSVADPSWVVATPKDLATLASASLESTGGSVVASGVWNELGIGAPGSIGRDLRLTLWEVVNSKGPVTQAVAGLIWVLTTGAAIWATLRQWVHGGNRAA